MSWSISKIGTRDEIKAALPETFASVETYYAPGTLEGDDVATCKARAGALLDAYRGSADKKLSLYAYGSHYTGTDGFLGGQFHLTLSDAPTT